MGLDAGIRFELPEATSIDLPEINEYLTEALLATLGHTAGRYCFPAIYRGDTPRECVVIVQVGQWGYKLEESGFRVGDIHRTLAAAVFDRFDPAEELIVETLSE